MVMVMLTKFDWSLIAEKTYNFCGVEALDGTLQYINPAATRLFGFSPEEVIGKSLSEFIHPDDVEEYRHSVQSHHLCEEECLISTYRLRRANNSWRYVEENRCRFAEGDGGHILVIKDITANKELESVVASQNEFLQLVLDTIPQQIFWKNNDLTFLGCNRAWANQARLKGPESVIGKSDYELCPTIDMAEFYRIQDQKVLDSGEPQMHVLEEKTRLDGSKIWLDVSKVLMKDHNGNTIGILGSIENITERMLLEDAAHKRQHQIQQQSDALIELNRVVQLQDYSLEEAVKCITAKCAAVLRLCRVSAWKVLEEHDYLKCFNLYKASSKSHLQGLRLKKALINDFLAELHQKSLIVVDASDLQESHRGFYNAYLREFGIASAICVGPQKDGAVCGVLVFESCTPRTWMVEDIIFAQEVAALVKYAVDTQATKYLQSELAIKEAKFRNLYELSPLPTVIIDQEGTITSVNNKWVEEVGYSKEDSVGDSVYAYMPLPSVEKFISEGLHSLKQDHEFRKKLYQLERADGSCMDVLIDGAAVGLGENLLIIRDITQQLHNERELLRYSENLEQEVRVRTEQIFQTEQRFKELFDTSPLGNAVINLETFIVEEANQVYADMLGLPLTEVVGRPLKEFTHPDDWHVDAALLEKSRRDHVGVEFEKRYLTKGGEIVWARVKTAFIKNECGADCNLGIIEDITGKRKQQERLKLLEAVTKFSQDAVTLVKVSPDLVEKKVIYVNPVFSTMTGYPEVEALGPTYHVCPTTVQLIEEVSKTEQSSKVEGSVTRKDGSQFWGEVTVTQLKDNIYAVIIVDISERKRMEESLRVALSNERDASETKSRFVSMVSHEIRNPISIIKTSSRLLSQYFEDVGPERRQVYFDKIEGAVNKIVALTDDVVELGKTSHVTFKPSEVHLESFVQQTVNDINEESDSERHPVNLTIYGEPKSAQLDIGLLRQMLNNLIHNAQKYSPEGSDVAVTLEFTKDVIKISVKDQGIGIPKQDLGSLFHPFHRASNVKAIPGTGLGLIIVKRAVEAHGGTIKVASTEGQGTEFRIKLPYEKKEESTVQ